MLEDVFLITLQKRENYLNDNNSLFLSILSKNKSSSLKNSLIKIQNEITDLVHSAINAFSSFKKNLSYNNEDDLYNLKQTLKELSSSTLYNNPLQLLGPILYYKIDKIAKAFASSFNPKEIHSKINKIYLCTESALLSLLNHFLLFPDLSKAKIDYDLINFISEKQNDKLLNFQNISINLKNNFSYLYENIIKQNNDLLKDDNTAIFCEKTTLLLSTQADKTEENSLQSYFDIINNIHKILIQLDNGYLELIKTEKTEQDLNCLILKNLKKFIRKYIRKQNPKEIFKLSQKKNLTIIQETFLLLTTKDNKSKQAIKTIVAMLEICINNLLEGDPNNIINNLIIGSSFDLIKLNFFSLENIKKDLKELNLDQATNSMLKTFLSMCEATINNHCDVFLKK